MESDASVQIENVMEKGREISNSDFGFRSAFTEESVNIFVWSFKGDVKPQVTHLEILADVHVEHTSKLHLVCKIQCTLVLLTAPALETPYWTSRKAQGFKKPHKTLQDVAPLGPYKDL